MGWTIPAAGSFRIAALLAAAGMVLPPPAAARLPWTSREVQLEGGEALQIASPSRRFIVRVRPVGTSSRIALIRPHAAGITTVEAPAMLMWHSTLPYLAVSDGQGSGQFYYTDVYRIGEGRVTRLNVSPIAASAFRRATGCRIDPGFVSVVAEGWIRSRAELVGFMEPWDRDHPCDGDPAIAAVVDIRSAKVRRIYSSAGIAASFCRDKGFAEDHPYPCDRRPRP